MKLTHEDAELPGTVPVSNGSRPKTKARRFRESLTRKKLTFLMEAHDGLSARIVEDAGFEGIWASGLAISTVHGARDCNELSWTQVVDAIEFMNDCVSSPIVLDGDTGFGNFNNARRLVAKLCQIGIAGVCLEDKVFPKENSFIGDGQKLAHIDEFCGKIRACKDVQTDPDFTVIARIEALIAGLGHEEALRRAHAYRDAGADALVIHSKKRVADEVLEFVNNWDNSIPVILIPTTYSSTPVEEFEKAGVSLVIWANHNLRASMAAMQETSREIHKLRSVSQMENRLVSVPDIFDFMDYSELDAAELKYLSTDQRSLQ